MVNASEAVDMRLIDCLIDFFVVRTLNITWIHEAAGITGL